MCPGRSALGRRALARRDLLNEDGDCPEATRGPQGFLCGPRAWPAGLSLRAEKTLSHTCGHIRRARTVLDWVVLRWWTCLRVRARRMRTGGCGHAGRRYRPLLTAGGCNVLGRHWPITSAVDSNFSYKHLRESPAGDGRPARQGLDEACAELYKACRHLPSVTSMSRDVTLL